MIETVGIHGAPRSGTTWIGEIFNSDPQAKYCYQPFYVDSKIRGLRASEWSIIETRFQRWLNTDDSAMSKAHAREIGMLPTFTKCRDVQLLCYKETRYHNILLDMLSSYSTLRVCLIVRNPLAVISSWIKTIEKIMPEVEPMQNWLTGGMMSTGPEEFNGYWKWRELTQMFEEIAQLLPQRVRLIRYEDMVRDPHSMTKELFEFFDMHYGPQTIDFIDHSISTKSSDLFSVYRDEDTTRKWCDSLPNHIVDYISSDVVAHGLNKYLES